MDKSSLSDLHVLVEHVGPVADGDHIFREGDPFDAIAAVRAGTVKTNVVDRDGHEHVLGFHLPGEVIGLTRSPMPSIRATRSRSTPWSCAVSRSRRWPCWPRGCQGSRSSCSGCYHRTSARRCCWPATSRGPAHGGISGFAVAPLALRGFSATHFQLPMSRTDIGNYLRLAPETVSRVLRRFQSQQWVLIDRRELQIRDLPKVQALAEAVLRE